MTAAAGMLQRALALEEAGGRLWDVLVIGAGPAGAMAAREAARQGAAVLLVDRLAFPRAKVCGCCVNAAALDALDAASLGGLTASLGARPLTALHLAAGRRRTSIPLPGGAAVSRERFDAALVEAARHSGAQFLPGVEAALGPVGRDARAVVLSAGTARAQAAARVVLAADGLAGRSLRAVGGCEIRVAAHAPIGAGATADHAPGAYHPGAVFMACGAGGYAGLVRLEDGRLNIAASLDRRLVRAAGGVPAAVERLLAAAGLPAVEGLDRLTWRGTPLLTRRRARLAAERVLIVGDAAGYVEPFTGEGIAWALMSGREAAPLAIEALSGWHAELGARWQRRYRELLGHRQRRCRAVTRLLRHERLTVVLTAALAAWPGLARPLVASVNAPLRRRNGCAAVR